MKRIMEAARQRGTEAADRMHTAYHTCLTSRGRPCSTPNGWEQSSRPSATPASQKLGDTLDHFVPLVQQVIAQTTRRVIQGEAVPAPEKLVSLFEPHTAIIRKGKPGKPTEFGRVLWLDEVEGGIISRYAVLEGNPAEDAQLPPSLDHHLRVFARPPRLLAGDRGVHSTANEQYATTHGVKAGGLAQARGEIGQAARPRAAALVPAWARLAGGHRRAHQWPQTAAWAGPVPLSRDCRDGTLGRLGRHRPRSAGDRPSDGDLTRQAGPKDGRCPYIWSESGEA